MMSNITITCFAASYAVALLLEGSRILFRAPVRLVVTILFAVAGLFAHSLYLINKAQGSVPLASWYDFCLVSAWVVAGAYLGLMLRRPENAIGVFLLPLILALIGVAFLFESSPPFAPRTAMTVWRVVHGVSLLLGTTAVVLGFATGLMYLLQSYRLKHKLPPGRGFKLPSLEWLQRFNRETLIISTGALAIGLISGVALNAISRSAQGGGIAWTDPVVLSSGILFLWLTVVTIFEGVYRPARQGQKVAYLTLASFVFLGLALYFVLFGAHAS
jgi:ABC-type uncharacterized transport system permease subunit